MNLAFIHYEFMNMLKFTDLPQEKGSHYYAFLADFLTQTYLT